MPTTAKYFFEKAIDVDTLQKDINIISNWWQTWLIKLNVDKCKVMHMGKNNLKATYSLIGVELETSKIEKYKGVFISDDLKWSKHVQTIAAPR